MNKKDALLAARILQPLDNELVLEGSYGSNGILMDLFSHSFAKKIIQTSVAATIALSGMANAYADNAPEFSIDNSYSISSVLVTHDDSLGSQYDSGKVSELVKMLKGTKDRKETINIKRGESEVGKYINHLKSNINITLDQNAKNKLSLVNDLEQSNKLAVNSSILKGLNEQSLFDSFKEIKEIVGKSAIDNIQSIHSDFNIDESNYSNELNELNNGDIESMADDVVANLSKNENLIQVFKVYQKINNVKDTVGDYDQSFDEDGNNESSLLSKEDKNNQMIMMSIYMILTDTGENFSWDNVVDSIAKDNHKIITNEINSNIAEHYNLSTKDIDNLAELTIYVHETGHYYDVSNDINKMHDLTTKEQIKTKFSKSFNRSSSMESFAELSGVPIAAAVYAKQNNLDPLACLNASIDHALAFRAATLVNFNLQTQDPKYDIADTHGGAVYSAIYMNNHRDQLEDMTKSMYNNLPDDTSNLDFEDDIAPMMDYIADNLFNSTEFQKGLDDNVKVNTLFESLSMVSKVGNLKNNNLEVDVLQGLDNLPYRVIDDGKYNTPVQKTLLEETQNKINHMQLKMM